MHSWRANPSTYGAELQHRSFLRFEPVRRAGICGITATPVIPAAYMLHSSERHDSAPPGHIALHQSYWRMAQRQESSLLHANARRRPSPHGGPASPSPPANGSCTRKQVSTCLPMPPPSRRAWSRVPIQRPPCCDLHGRGAALVTIPDRGLPAPGPQCQRFLASHDLRNHAARPQFPTTAIAHPAG